METWKWVEGGLELDGKMHALPKLERRLAGAIVHEINHSAELYEVLSEAKGAFIGGKASYEAAAENLSHLLNELQHADLRWRQALETLSGQFVPPIRSTQIPTQLATKFAYECILKINDQLVTKEK